MLRSKILLWITFDFCVTIGTCADLFEKSGNDIKMDCAGVGKDVEWKLNNNLLIGMSRSGVVRKGKSETTSRSRIEKTALKISSLTSADSGVYTCRSSTYTLYVMSAHANPSTVLYSRETKLSCDVTGGFKGTFEWLAPKPKMSWQSKDVTVESVTLDHAGNWTCKIKNHKGEELKNLVVSIAVVGPLNTSGEVKTYEGDTAELACFLPAPSKLPIRGGSWTRDPASDVCFPTLMTEQNRVKWNGTDVKPNRVTFSDQELKANFNVILKKVKHEDAGVYVCNLEFEGGRSLSTHLTLTVLKRNGVVYDDEGYEERKDTMWHKRVGGMQLWVWVAVTASSFVLIGLVVIVLLIHCRNKRMKKKVKKLRSMRQPLSSRNYCKCDRTVRQPGTGKRARPPPLPRNQYTSLNE